MPRYEIVFVASSVLSEEEADAQVTGLEKIVAELGGTVRKVDRWGRRKLAYPIQRMSEGHYTLILYDAEPEVEHELVRRLKLTDTIVRFLSVRADHEKLPTADEIVALEEARKEHLRRAAERAAQEAAGLVPASAEATAPGWVEPARDDLDIAEIDDDELVADEEDET